MLEIIKQGGSLVYVILAFSIIGLAVVIERAIYFMTIEKKHFFMTNQTNYKKMKEKVIECIKGNDIEAAKEVCLSYDNSVSRVIGIILENKMANKELLEEKVREVALDQIPILEKFMWILATTAHITPLVGLLGTVTGMIKAFDVIAIQGVGKPEKLAEGISQALITTAAGLSVAIPALVCYNYLNKKIDLTINEMEKASVEFMDILGR